MIDAPISMVWVLCAMTFAAFIACSYAAADFTKTWAQITIKIFIALCWLAVCVRLFIPLVAGLDPTISWFGTIAYSSLAAMTIVEVALNSMYRFHRFKRT
jgi:hypothetical protein